ncbi:MAG TPA: hypothetical protein VLH61_10765 [Bacteroidales bacterium]|nr:hypothetical protein [Bacteroidales bacterium]
MYKILQFINHRDFVLSLALVVGFIFGERLRFLAEISVYSLGVVMIFATSGFSFRNWWPLQKVVAPLAWSALLNYLVFGIVVLVLGWLLMGNEAYFPYFVGMALLVASPPGPSVVPFSALLKGDEKFSVTGVFGLHLFAMIFAPAIMFLLLGQAKINPLDIFLIMIKTILLPLLISRVLRLPFLVGRVTRAKDSVIKWGFFLVIAPIMGMSAEVLFAELYSLALITGIFVFAMYFVGFGYFALMRKLGYARPFLVSSTFMLTTKSSAFAAVTAFTFFGDDPRVALPAAIVSVLVTLFVIVFSGYLKYCKL